MYKSYSMELAGRTLTVDIGRVAAQANGAVFIKYGDTTVLSTATASDKPRDGVDFFPLSVEFEEKMYSVGKIPGGFNKREGKASENAILTDRVIDRPMRSVMRLASQSVSMRAVLFLSRCSRISRKLLLLSRWRRQYSQMRSRSVRKI